MGLYNKEVTYTHFSSNKRIQEGFHCLGHYCQPNNQPLRGFVLAARANDPDHDHRPPLKEPVKYTLVWSSDSDCYFWLPVPPAGYRAVGVIVTDEAEEPKVEEVRCVREDLTESCVLVETQVDASDLEFVKGSNKPVRTRRNTDTRVFFTLDCIFKARRS
ncbi:uncharacterized protein LOC112085116 [Eutrema salsugineum]|uniref:uncharacterized protein LOC112085116 n=1 Tax=Eutrema salsugineum TaxID=72664 RepID=UPI000CED068D|nr:uncharacterized protein LOC112085116 [Eutrema salsugineum]